MAVQKAVTLFGFASFICYSSGIYAKFFRKKVLIKVVIDAAFLPLF